MDILLPQQPTKATQPLIKISSDHLLDDETNAHQLYNNSTPSSDQDLYIDSASSTPFVSAPSSPGRPISHLAGFFYSCPSSPMHFSLMSVSNSSPPQHHTDAYEFEFPDGWSSSGAGRPGSTTMSSADELFLDGKIRPMKLSTHLERPQVLDPLLDLENEEEEEDEEINEVPSTNLDKLSGERRGRVRNSKSRSRRTRSMSPHRTSSFGFLDEEELGVDVKIESFRDGSRKGGNLGNGEGGFDKIEEEDTSGVTTSVEGTTSRSSSAGRSSKRWVFLKDFLLYRSKSEGRSNNKFWSNISFSPGKERKSATLGSSGEKVGSFLKGKGSVSNGSSSGGVKGSDGGGKKLVNGGVVGKRRVPTTTVSPHELHYRASRAQAEEMRKKTFLPYRQGLLGCLGFSSKGYGAMNGFARALNPVSSR